MIVWTKRRITADVRSQCCAPMSELSKPNSLCLQTCMRLLMMAILIFVPPTLAYCQLVVNEIMFKPSTIPDETPEWFELFNISDDSINLSGYLFSDVGEGSTHDPKVITTEDFIIAPDEYAVIAAFEWTGFGSCDVIIPPDWLAGLNNTSDDGVRIWAPDTTLVDSAIYVVDEHSCIDYGISLERIDPYGSSTDQLNWDCSTDPEGSTPCRANSVYSEPVPVDIAVTSLSTEPSSPEPDDTFTILVTVKNNGTDSASGFNLMVQYISDGDTTEIASESLPELASGASYDAEFALSLPVGTYTLLASVDDTVGTNNSLTHSLTISEPGSTPLVKITEIMFKPDDSSHEWIELYNAGTASADLKNWTISDPVYTGTISTESVLLLPGEYIIIAEFDTTFPCGIVYCEDWPYLNNDGDSIYIADSLGNIVDQAVYEVPGSWDSGISAERISLSSPGEDPSNWGASRTTAGSTPCEDNSLWGTEETGEVTITVSPNPFDPELENSEITVKAPADAEVQIRIYNLRGRLVRDLGYAFETTWDGRDDKGNPVPTGPYVLVAKIEQNGETKYKRFAIAVAKGMKY